VTDSIKEYVARRAELLTNLVLTKRKDVRILTIEGSKDVGVDFIVQVVNPIVGEKVFPGFGVQVKGTSQELPDEDAATKFAAKDWKLQSAKEFFLFPIVCFLFSMENDVGYYSWLLRPQVGKDASPGLIGVSPPEMKKITKRTADEIISQVSKWFEVMAEMLLNHASAK
jgi:hypothetical protein